MKKVFSKTAFTLIELIVALALVSVILLGVFAISMVLSSNSQDYGQRYLVRSQTQTTLNHILNDAALTVGSAGTVGTSLHPDTGVEIYTAGANSIFCFHQSNGNLGLASNPVTDNWVCYTYDGTTTDTNFEEITYCYVQYNMNDVNARRGAENPCSGVGAGVPQFLGTAFNVTLPAFTGNSNVQGIPVFNMSVTNCLSDRNSATGLAPFTFSGTCGTANNPQVTVSGGVTLQQTGMNQI